LYNKEINSSVYKEERAALMIWAAEQTAGGSVQRTRFIK